MTSDPAADTPIPAATPAASSNESNGSNGGILPGSVSPLPIDEKTVISKKPPLSPDALLRAPAPQILGEMLAGKRLEHYDLNEFVGGGGMGAVFRATDTRLGRTVAVKVLSRDHTDEETIRRFKNEAQSAARLDHPNIARVYYVGEDHGWNFIVFEFIEGTNLRDQVDRDGPLELEQALRYTLQVAEALSHSSSRDLVHRDIKPSNVLVTAGEQVKLVDMGLARLHQVDSDNDLTASGVTLGTFDYISPEQARDPRAADVRSDIYSLGCTLFFMLTGQPPFPEGTALQKLLRHNSDDPPDVRQFRPELHPKVSGLVARMLAKRPVLRQQSAAELSSDIVALGQQLGLHSLTEFGHLAIAPASSANQWRSKTWQALTAVAVLVAALIGLEAILSPRQAGGDMVMEARFKPLPKDATEAASDTSPTTPLPISADNAPPLGDSPAGPRSPASGIDIALGDANRANGYLAPATQNPPPQDSALRPTDPLAELAPTHETASVPVRPDAVGTKPPAQKSGALAPLEERVTHIVVAGEEPAPPNLHAEYAASLAEACARAAELGLIEVELRFNGARVELPFDVSNQRLAVRAGAGFQPAIVFRPQVRAGGQHMIRLAGGSSAHLALEGVELRLELPAGPPSDGWALIGMNTGQSLDLTSCVLTVQDGDADRAAVHDRVAMVAVQRRRSSETMTMADPQLAMGQQARVSLERCIARGEASLVALTDETPLSVRWNQGLLITSRHLIETEGTPTEPQYYEEIVLDLDNVTAYCREGLYRLRRGPGKNFQFHINSTANNCVFLTDPGAPLYEMVGVTIKPETEELQSTGEGNRFSPLDMPFLVVRANAGADPQIFKLGRGWSSETRSQAGVPWVHPPPLARPAHELTKTDFQIDVESAADGAGFDPLLLPEIAPPAVADDRSADSPSLAPGPFPQH